MRFLVVGLGSMGKRRVRNLQKHGEREIFGFDVRKDRAEEANKLYGIKTFSDFDNAMKEKPSVLVISCPPDRHLQYAKYALDNNLHFFSEVNTDTPDNMKKLVVRLGKENALVAAPSCTMRYHPSVIAIKNIISSHSLGEPLLLTYHSGENLEDWHPWEKVTDYYVGKKETGGGRDQIAFELEWIRWLIGKAMSVRALATKLSRSEADIYDVYDLVLQFENKLVSNVLVDVIQRPANRIFRLVCEDGVIHWDWMSHYVRVYDMKAKKLLEIPERPGYLGYLVEEMYEDEIKQFLSSLKDPNNKYPLTFAEELDIVNIVYAAEESSETGREISLN